MVSHLHRNIRFRCEYHVNSRSELDQPTLSAVTVSYLFRENDAPRQETGDLLEDDRRPSPSTVTMFCSLASAETDPIAFPNFPFRYSTLRITPAIGDRLT